MALKQLPQNLEAEKSVLGSCFLSNNALLMAIENLDETDFYDSRHSKIFKALKTLNEEKVPVDLTTLTSTLTKQNSLNDIGGITYLTEITTFVPTATNIEYYIKEVENSSLLRRLIETAESIATSGYNNEESINDNMSYPLTNEEYDSIYIKQDIVQSLEAPVAAGTKIGKVEVYLENEKLYEKEIFLKENIYKKNIMDYINEALSNMFKSVDII